MTLDLVSFRKFLLVLREFFHNEFWAYSPLAQLLPDLPTTTTQLYVLFSFPTHQVQLCLARYSWICDLPPEHGWPTYGNTLKENWLRPSSYPSPGVALLVRTLCVHLLSPRWELSLRWYRSCACCYNCWEFICATFLLCAENTVSWYSFTASSFYSLSSPSSAISLLS